MCGCGEPDFEPGQVFYYNPSDYSTHLGKISCRCSSCGTKIAPRDVIAAFMRFKVPDCDYEVSRFGDDGEVPRSPYRLCETCADIWFSLDELGFCSHPTDNQFENAKEAHAIAEFNRKGGEV